MLQAQLDVSGADATPWTSSLQSTLVQMLSQITQSQQITVVGSQAQYAACMRRLLVAEVTATRLTILLCSPAGTAPEVVSSLQELYANQSAAQVMMQGQHADMAAALRSWTENLHFVVHYWSDCLVQ